MAKRGSNNTEVIEVNEVEEDVLEAANELEEEVEPILKKDKQSKPIIDPPNLWLVRLTVVGTAPYCQLRFSEKAKNEMKEKMMLGEQAKKITKRTARNFDNEFEEAMYKLKDESRGIPASAFRNSAIDACRVAGFQMTKAKMSVFILQDGLDTLDKTPLVKIIGTPERYESTVSNANGSADIRTRALWAEWKALPLVKYDKDQFSISDVVNLFRRAGQQVGLGEGRPFSKKSCGTGFGTFDLTAYEDMGKMKDVLVVG